MIRKLLLVAAAIQLVLGSEEIKKASKDLKCKGEDINISDEQMMIILECAGEIGIMSKADLTPEKMPCFAKCLIVKKGLVDEDGKPHKEKIVDSIDGNMSPALQAEAKKLLSDCLDNHGAAADAKDVTCKSFSPLTDCIHKAFIQLCIDS